MIRTKQGKAIVWVRGEMLHDDPDATRALAHRILARQLAEVRGPRGGRYVGFGEIAYAEDDGVRFNTDEVLIMGRREMRYVRPER